MKLFTLLFLFPFLVSAQVQKNEELFLKLKELDSLLFETGFNNCQLESMQRVISDDLEFFHDQSGLSTTKAEFIGAIQQNICSSSDRKPVRILKEETLEVFPLYNGEVLYGAIQKGAHDFFIQEPQKKLYQTSTAKFTHVWLLKNGEWILEKVLSYDHQSVPTSR